MLRPPAGAAGPVRGDAVRASRARVVVLRLGVEALAHGQEDRVDREAERLGEAGGVGLGAPVTAVEGVEGGDVGEVARVRVVSADQRGLVEGAGKPAEGVVA